MIIVQADSMKGMELNVRDGLTLQFDKDGRCENVEPEVAILLYCFKGYTVTGLNEEQTKQAKEKKAQIEAEAAAQTKGPHLTGVVNGEMDSARPGDPSAPVVTVAGRMPKSLEERERKKTLEYAETKAVDTPGEAVTPPVEVVSKKKPLPSSLQKRK